MQENKNAVNNIYDELRKEAAYALQSHSRDLVYQTYGKASMARNLNAISKDEFSQLNTMLVRNGLNNPSAGLE